MRKITGVFYIPPPHPNTGLRKRLNRYKKISEYLAHIGCTTLGPKNFKLSMGLLGLGEPLEKSSKVFMLPQKSKSIYKEFFEELPQEDPLKLTDSPEREVIPIQCTLSFAISFISIHR